MNQTTHICQLNINIRIMIYGNFNSDLSLFDNFKCKSQLLIINIFYDT